MGTGKSSVAFELARLTGMSPIEVDEEIERTSRLSIPDIFSTLGEPAFRGMETEEIRRIAKNSGQIISTGGGAVLREENMLILKEGGGVVVCLWAEPDTILKRTHGSARPLLKVDDPLKKIKELLDFRRPYYERADVSIVTDDKTPSEIAGEALHKLIQMGYALGGSSVSGNALSVELGARTYDIVIAAGGLDNIGASMKAVGFKSGQKIALVTNPTVYKLNGDGVENSLKAAGFKLTLITVPDGEEYKTLDTVNAMLGEMLKSGLDRRSGIVALGGGVIGDMAGFAASVYMRGIRYIQLPTTLLAQVDSSVGGKTGVNHPLGKNLIGSFYQPSLVVIDTDTLKTLPQRQFRAGMAEVIKYGVIWDAELFEYLVENSTRIASLDAQALKHIIRRSCAIKAEVVSRDEREGGLRAMLNYGHTIGHAVEAVTGYGTYLHGEAVAIGMVVEAVIAARMGMVKEADLENIKSIVRLYGLPDRLPSGISADAMMSAMMLDKKTIGGSLRFALPTGIGSAKAGVEVDAGAVISAIRD